VADELEVLAIEQVFNVGFLAREQIVEADDIVAHTDQSIAEMGAEETGAASDKDALHHGGRMVREMHGIAGCGNAPPQRRCA
jgi:hypothetical protein